MSAICSINLFEAEYIQTLEDLRLSVTELGSCIDPSPSITPLKKSGIYFSGIFGGNSNIADFLSTQLFLINHFVIFLFNINIA